jgi:hypothetical protein
MSDARLPRVCRLLEENGIAPVVGVAGHAQDVLAVRASVSELERVRGLAPDLRAAGFRYVTIELEMGDVS